MSFCFFSCFWDIVFPLCTFSPGLGITVHFQWRAFSVPRKAHVWGDHTVKSTVCRYIFRALFRGSAQLPEHLYLNAYVQHYSLHFLSMCSKNSATFSSYSPYVQPHCLAWACLPTPQLEQQNGTHWSYKVTSFRYGLAFHICIPLMTWAVLQLFFKWTWRFEHLDVHDNDLGLVSSKPFAGSPQSLMSRRHSIFQGKEKNKEL